MNRFQKDPHHGLQCHSRLTIALIAINLALLTSGISAAARQVERASGAFSIVRIAASVDRAALLDSLFSRLKRAGDAERASQIEQQIWQAWLTFDEPEIDALMGQAGQAMNAGHQQAALDILDRIVEKAPDFAEGWNKRATVLYLVGRHDESLQDIERVLALEPRHFGAISGIALIMLAKGDHAAVLAAVERALRIHPFLPGAADLIRRAGGSERGQPI